MPYVQREGGVVTGCFGSPQPGFAEEWLEDDDPEVVAFLNPPPPPDVPTAGEEVAFDHENRIRALEGVPPLSQEEFTGKKMSG